MAGPKTRRIGWTLAVILLALVVVLLPAGAAAKKKHKKKKKQQTPITQTQTTPLPPVITSGQAAYPSATSASTAASCPGGTHVSGGGWSVAPHLEGSSGLRTFSSGSTATGTTGWTASSDAFTGPASSATLTSYAVCENDQVGQIATAVSGSTTIPAGQLTHLVISCPGGTHVLNAGYSTTALAAHNNNANNLRTLVMESRRTAVNEWTISAFEANIAMTSGNISVSALCERDATGRSISETSAQAGISTTANTRTSSDTSCPPGQQVIGGGYALAPLSGTLPSVGVDEFQPVGSSGWHLGLHTFLAQPAGESVTTYAYCSADQLTTTVQQQPAKKKKKKKKKKKR